MIIIRYADDVVLGFESKSDANRYRAELDKRLAKFALNLHPKKTKLIRFGRWAMRDSKRFYGVKPATYFSVPGNYKSLAYFFIRVERLWLRSLRRRSQRNIMRWARFHRIKMIIFAPIKVLHPYPKARFDTKTQGRSPVC